MTRWLVAMVAAGCHDRAYVPCDGRDESADARVDTSSGVPVFDWEFGAASLLSVRELGGDGREVWHLQCVSGIEDNDRLAEQVCIPTPIAYGDPVDSPSLYTQALTGPEPLTPGASYELWLDTPTEDAPPSGLPPWLGFLERDNPRCGSAYGAQVDFVAPDPAGGRS